MSSLPSTSIFLIFYRLINKIYDETRNKNPNVRAKFAQYFLIILTTYPEDILEKYQTQIENFLNHDLSDAKPEVRSIARMCFFKYKEMFPHRARNIYSYLDVSIQKAINEEDEGKLLSKLIMGIVSIMETIEKMNSTYVRPNNESAKTYYGGEKFPKLFQEEESSVSSVPSRTNYAKKKPRGESLTSKGYGGKSSGTELQFKK